MQKRRFCSAKEPLLHGQSGSFERSKCRFHHTFLFVLRYFMPYTPQQKAYSIHTYTHNSILTADRQKDKYCTQKVPLFAINLLVVQKNANIGVFHGQKINYSRLIFYTYKQTEQIFFAIQQRTTKTPNIAILYSVLASTHTLLSKHCDVKALMFFVGRAAKELSIALCEVRR